MHSYSTKGRASLVIKAESEEQGAGAEPEVTGKCHFITWLLH